MFESTLPGQDLGQHIGLHRITEADVQVHRALVLSTMRLSCLGVKQKGIHMSRLQLNAQ